MVLAIRQTLPVSLDSNLKSKKGLCWLNGLPTSKGAYELDLSLVDDFSKAWREMHVKTDVFCSGSVVLPDKAGRLINVGGWSLVSTFGVRLYTPSGSPGVNGTTDWEENPDELQLQVSQY